LEEKVAAPVQKTENTAVGIRHADHVVPLYPQKLALTSPTSRGRSVGIVSSRTQATEFSFIILVKFWNCEMLRFGGGGGELVTDEYGQERHK
jgi:hypothetical protein